MAFVLQFLFVAFNAGFVLLLIYNYYWKRRNLPPGPPPLPLIGNMLEIIRKPPGDECYLQWAKRYGSVFTFWMGETPAILITDYKTMVDTFQKEGDVYSGRMYIEEVDQKIKGGLFGIVNVDGNLWREQRRFALQVFRNLGLGKNVMQDKVLVEINSRFEALNKKLGKQEEHDLCAVVDMTTGSIINAILFGYRFDELKELMGLILKRTTSPSLVIQNIKPSLFQKLPYFGNIFNEVVDSLNAIFKFIDRQVDEHAAELAELDENAPITDYCAAFLNEIKIRETSNQPHSFCRGQLRNACLDLWMAGQETTSTTIAWGINYLIRTPDALKKLYHELDTVISDTNRIITVADRLNLPYTNAVIDETQRIANLLPLNLLHKTTREVNIQNYTVPKGSIVIPQISNILCDENIFENPKEFNPDRFIDENGQFIKNEQLIPFSIGKRQCLGESLARMELFLIVANLFNQYKISRGAKLPSIERLFGIAVACPPFTCKIERR